MFQNLLYFAYKGYSNDETFCGEKPGRKRKAYSSLIALFQFFSSPARSPPQIIIFRLIQNQIHLLSPNSNLQRKRNICFTIYGSGHLLSSNTFPPAWFTICADRLNWQRSSDHGSLYKKNTAKRTAIKTAGQQD